MDATADAKPEPTDAAASKVSEPQAAGNPTVTGEDAKPPSTEPAIPAPKAGKKRAASDGAAATKAAKRQKVELTVGDKGVFFTTVNTGGAANAKRDLQNLLEDVQGADAKMARQEENSPPGKPKFVPCTEAGKGSGLLKLVSDSPEPSKVVSQMLEAQRAGFLSTGMVTASRLICRVLPLDNLCKPFLDDFRQLAQAVLPPHLGADVAATTWALEFKARNTNTLKKEAVLEVLDAIIPKGHHKVNLNDPAKCILVEVQPSWCGLSVVENWARLKKYNLHALTTPEDNKTKVSNAVFEEVKKPEEPNAKAEARPE
ncbi:Thumpd1 [Symbiodinium necroappetens]|uniref:Thumpd1 protein n=1 Tax=Symbiodinium necroappetens TaxID=1628268 RepID=A0A812PEI3_9DINO|nr:Thumpd1 [Symbiodinium necroappetens]